MLKRSLKKAAVSPVARAAYHEDISKELKESIQEYYHIKGSDKELRDSTQEQLAEVLVLAGNTTRETMIKVIRHREKQRSTARKIDS